eukprot:6483473-Amphidinium_carterae.1
MKWLVEPCEGGQYSSAVGSWRRRNHPEGVQHWLQTLTGLCIKTPSLLDVGEKGNQGSKHSCAAQHLPRYQRLGLADIPCATTKRSGKANPETPMLGEGEQRTAASKVNGQVVRREEGASRKLSRTDDSIVYMLHRARPQRRWRQWGQPLEWGCNLSR